MNILLLEDDASIASTIRFVFERERWAVTHCTLLRDARAACASQVFRAHVLDIGVPDGSGLDLCRELREKNAAPVIMLSARGEEIDRVLGLELGADDYLTKPFSPRELVARVKVALRRAAPVESQRFHHDQTGQRISFHGQWLDLTRREYGCLAALLRAPGRILSREHLLETVWGSDAESTDRTVDTHIKTLRAKLKNVDETDCIVTHRGMGYSIHGK
jgi:two-component system, OmpR family, catabolic regulation response regulator CreB